MSYGFHKQLSTLSFSSWKALLMFTWYCLYFSRPFLGIHPSLTLCATKSGQEQVLFLKLTFFSASDVPWRSVCFWPYRHRVIKDVYLSGTQTQDTCKTVISSCAKLITTMLELILFQLPVGKTLGIDIGSVLQEIHSKDQVGEFIQRKKFEFRWVLSWVTYNSSPVEDQIEHLVYFQSDR